MNIDARPGVTYKFEWIDRLQAVDWHLLDLTGLAGKGPDAERLMQTVIPESVANALTAETVRHWGSADLNAKHAIFYGVLAGMDLVDLHKPLNTSCRMGAFMLPLLGKPNVTVGSQEIPNAATLRVIWIPKNTKFVITPREEDEDTIFFFRGVSD